MTKAALLVFLVLGCGSVTAKPEDGAAGAGGSQAPTGGAAGDVHEQTGGAGELGGRGGQVGTGGAGGELGAAGQGGQGAGALIAPTCKGTFVAPGMANICPMIPSPSDPTNPNAGWECARNCSSDPTEDAKGCVFSGVTYCVTDCSACHA